jgi:predicted SAM-dependent methyltransferase
MNPAKEYLKSRTTKALRSAVYQVGWEFRLNLRHRASVKKAYRFLQDSPLKLSLGSGPNAKSGWLNIDLFDPSADLQLDLREHWPFPDGSVSHIYSEHVFEHFDFRDEVPHLLSESLRVLQTAGRFDVGVPDTAWPLHAYGNPDDSYWRFDKAILPKSYEMQLDVINYHFRQDKEHGEHKYAWDEETLARSLQRSGFVGVVRREFDPTLDSESRKKGTLYMRATKP